MSKASEILFASQPTISLQIKKLESELGVKLFERRGPKLKITTEGEILYNIAIPLVQGIDHIKDEFQSRHTDLAAGELTIAAEESTLLYTLPGPIREFVQQYPGIRVKLSNVTGRNGRELVLADEVDLAVSSMLDTPANMNYSPFVSYPPILITPKGHPLSKVDNITMQDIGKYGLILPPSHFSSWRLIKMVFALNGVSFNVALEAGGWEVVKSYVALGLGISIVTSICIGDDEDREKFEIIPLEKYFPSRKYGVVTRKNKVLSSPAQRFIDILHAHYSKNAKQLVA
ncbi:MAG: LysR family transcriptional regulator [uncultured Thiotrichaceae bacterium]|uniref:LysR family transcriptional regulator n=1 Tax=uncultured Thiotrichaceae bacterium TaxID=298394 RepID=A0A6S6TJ69_9GAMM|nr:MAG: LysR family transcriptional regulator [uncultured Thiotrichaceae bacterium]